MRQSPKFKKILGMMEEINKDIDSLSLIVQKEYRLKGNHYKTNNAAIEKWRLLQWRIKTIRHEFAELTQGSVEKKVTTGIWQPEYNSKVELDYQEFREKLKEAAG